MARKPTTTIAADTQQVNEAALERAESAGMELVRLEDETTDNAKALALQLGYQGGLAPDALENSAREAIRRMSMAVMEVGGYLLLLREQCDHGDFHQRLERLDMQPRVAQQYMQVTLRFSNAKTSSHLEAIGKSKLVEMLVLDDQEIDELAGGGTIRGLTVDKIDQMGVRELRAALRQSEKDSQFNAEKRQKAEADRDKLEKKFGGNRPVVVPLDERITPFQVEITGRQSLIDKALAAHHEAVVALESWWQAEPGESNVLPRSVQLVLIHLDDAVTRTAGLVGALQQEIAMRFGPDIDAARQFAMSVPDEQAA